MGGAAALDDDRHDRPPRAALQSALTPVPVQAPARERLGSAAASDVAAHCLLGRLSIPVDDVVRILPR